MKKGNIFNTMKPKVFRIRFAPFVYLMQRILFRMTLFSFLLLLSSALLYVTGNFQRFLDSSQAFILREAMSVAVTLFFFSIASIVVTILDSVFSKFFSWTKVVFLVFYVFCIALSTASVIIARGILALSAGFPVSN